MQEYPVPLLNELQYTYLGSTFDIESRFDQALIAGNLKKIVKCVQEFGYQPNLHHLRQAFRLGNLSIINYLSTRINLDDYLKYFSKRNHNALKNELVYLYSQSFINKDQYFTYYT